MIEPRQNEMLHENQLVFHDTIILSSSFISVPDFHCADEAHGHEQPNDYSCNTYPYDPVDRLTASPLTSRNHLQRISLSIIIC